MLKIMFHPNFSFSSLFLLMLYGSILLLSKNAIVDAQQQQQQHQQPYQTTITTNEGKSVKIMGKRTNRNGASIESFLGIRYADASERFSPSQRISFSDPYYNTTAVDATKYGSNCHQPSFGPPSPVAIPQSEDCLFLNIWRPSSLPSANNAKDDDASSSLRPVMVWIHGGGFVTGSGSEPLYDGSNLVAASIDDDADTPVIVVTLNYRLGVFGLLVTEFGTDHEKGNGGMNALGDQIEALKWVQDNIEAFGGDPRQVTIFGESIGGVSVCYLSCSPEAKGLFHRAIVQSGQCLTDRLAPISVEAGIERTKQILLDANVSSVEELKVDLTAEELTSAAGMSFTNAVIDSYIMPRMPLEIYQEGLLNPVDMIIGSNTVDDPSMLGFPPFLYAQRGNQIDSYMRETFSNSDDADRILEAYSPENFYNGNNVSAYAHFTGDFLLRCGGREMSALAANAVSGNVYLYIFAEHTSNDIGNGIIATAGITNVDGWASHTVEVPFVFGNLDYTYLGPARFPPTKVDIALSRKEVIPRWLGFTKKGVPGEDWTAVPKIKTYEKIGDCGLSRLASLMISSSETVVREFPGKQLQCDTIPRYSISVAQRNPCNAEEERLVIIGNVTTQDESSSSSCTSVTTTMITMIFAFSLHYFNE